MPVITFDRQHLDEGFMFLARRGEVGCLPDDVFVITDTLFDQLKQSNIPFTQIEKERASEQGDASASNKRRRKADDKVSV
jgi:hypothetical protein